MDNTITIKFIGEGTKPGRVKYEVVQDCPPENIPVAAQALLYLAASLSPDGFEKEIEKVTENAMKTRARRVT